MGLFSDYIESQIEMANTREQADQLYELLGPFRQLKGDSWHEVFRHAVKIGVPAVISIGGPEGLYSGFLNVVSNGDKSVQHAIATGRASRIQTIDLEAGGQLVHVTTDDFHRILNVK